MDEQTVVVDAEEPADNEALSANTDAAHVGADANDATDDATSQGDAAVAATETDGATDAEAQTDGDSTSETAVDEQHSQHSQLIDHQVDGPLIEELSAREVQDLTDGDTDAEDPALADFVPDVLDMHPTELRGVIESLLLVSSKPLKIERIEKCLPGTNRHYLLGFLRGMSERYTREQRGWDVRSVGGGWQMLTRIQFHPWVRQLDKRALPTRLSKSAMETLAIVAYKQPVARGRIEDIRGVQCGPMLRQLMDMHLIMVAGRDEETLGRPLLYATSEQFLERFGLSSAEDLPRQHEFGA